LARTGVHGADVPVGADSCADTIVLPDGRVAPLFQAEGQEEGQEEKESRQKVSAKSKEKVGEEKEKGRQKETPPLTQLAMTPAGASRRDAPAATLGGKSCAVRRTP